MSRKSKTACCVLAFLIMATVTLPVKSLRAMAAEVNFVQVYVTDEAEKTQYTTAAKTVSEFFVENNILLNAKDYGNVNMTDAVYDGMEIVITRGITVIASVNGIWEKRRVSPGTTAEQLQVMVQSEYGEALSYDGNMQKILEDNDILPFYTWKDETVTQTEEIPFDTHEIETTAVMEGQSHVRQEGVPGIKEVTSAVIYIGGEEEQKTIVDEVIVAEPIPRIIDVGIGGTLGTTTDTNAPDFHYVDKYVMNASAYTAGYESTGKNPGDLGYGRTAMGLQVTRGIVAVDPNIIPLGTKLYVEGYGFSLAADTGSAIKGYKIDLFYESLDDAIQFGRRDLEVYVLE